MQGLFFRPFNNLDETDLRELVEVRKVREHIQLEYKQESYNHNHDGAVEMLADVTSMANTQGGYILIGVEEDKTETEGTPKSLLGVKDGNAEAKWVQSVCLSSIDEKIPGLQVRDIPIANGLSCVVIQIPNSLKKPHMVVHEKHRSFRMRHGRDKGFMGMQEVRNMILSMNAYQASLAKFTSERKQELKELAKGKPWFLLMATPIYVDNDKLNPLRDDLRYILEMAPGNPDGDNFPTGISAGKPQPRIYGVEAMGKLGFADPQYLRYLRLFRNGHLEYCTNFISRSTPSDWPSSPMAIYPYEMTVTILHFLEVAKQVLYLGEVNEPIAVTVHLENCNPSYLPWWKYESDTSHMLSIGNAKVWDKASLSLPLVADDLSTPEFWARVLMDRMFAAFGSEPARNVDFDKDGHFVKSKN